MVRFAFGRNRPVVVSLRTRRIVWIVESMDLTAAVVDMDCHQSDCSGCSLVHKDLLLLRNRPGCCHTPRIAVRRAGQRCHMWIM